MTPDYNTALSIEQNLPPGPYKVKISYETRLTKDEVKAMRRHLISSGVDILGISSSGKTLTVRAMKPESEGGISGWFVPIILAIGAAGTGWMFWKTAEVAEDTTESLTELAIPITLILVGGLVLYGMVKRPPTYVVSKLPE